MNKHTSNIFLVVLIVVLTAWGSPAFTAESPEVHPYKGIVVFYRLNKREYGTIPLNVNHTKRSLGQLVRGKYLYEYFDPGSQAFWSKIPSQDTITLEVEEGKVYYVRSDLRKVIEDYRTKFTLMSEAEGKADLARLK